MQNACMLFAGTCMYAAISDTEYYRCLMESISLLVIIFCHACIQQSIASCIKRTRDEDN